MKIVSFNTNGIRARPHQLEALVQRHAPEVIGIQETKVQDEEFPLAMVTALGYRAHFHGQKSHYGVALLSRLDPLRVQRGYPCDGEDSQRRLITGVYPTPGGEELIVINGYFPQGESRDHAWKFPAKRKFYADPLRYLQENFRPDQLLVVLAPGTEATGEELRAWCKERLAGYKCPTSIEFRDELARTATGKLQKFKLRAPFWDGRDRQVN